MREIRTSGLMSGEGRRIMKRHRALPRLYWSSPYLRVESFCRAAHKQPLYAGAHDTKSLFSKGGDRASVVAPARQTPVAPHRRLSVRLYRRCAHTATNRASRTAVWPRLGRRLGMTSRQSSYGVWISVSPSSAISVLRRGMMSPPRYGWTKAKLL